AAIAAALDCLEISSGGAALMGAKPGGAESSEAIAVNPGGASCAIYCAFSQFFGSFLSPVPLYRMGVPSGPVWVAGPAAPAGCPVAPVFPPFASTSLVNVPTL